MNQKICGPCRASVVLALTFVGLVGCAARDTGKAVRGVERMLTRAETDPYTCEMVDSSQLRELRRVADTTGNPELRAASRLIDEVQESEHHASALLAESLLGGNAWPLYSSAARSELRALAQCRMDRLAAEASSELRTERLQRVLVAAASAGVSVNLSRGSYMELYEGVYLGDGGATELSYASGLAMLRVVRPGDSKNTALETTRRLLRAAKALGYGYNEVVGAFERGLDDAVSAGALTERGARELRRRFLQTEVFERPKELSSDPAFIEELREAVDQHYDRSLAVGLLPESSSERAEFEASAETLYEAAKTIDYLDSTGVLGSSTHTY
jgi:uncharacterized protein YwbE